MIHVGMHPDNDVYFLEKRARREKYEHLGEDGKPFPRNALKGQPDRLFVGFDLEDVASRIRRPLPVSRDTLKCCSLHRLFVDPDSTRRMTSPYKHPTMQVSTSVSSSRISRSPLCTTEKNLDASYSSMFLRSRPRIALSEASRSPRL